jgi:hypothetical protein
MLKEKSGSVVSRPKGFAQTRYGPDEGLSTWYPDIFADTLTRPSDVARHAWWADVKLAELYDEPALPDGRWYKTTTDIESVIRGFELCCQSFVN